MNMTRDYRRQQYWQESYLEELLKLLPGELSQRQQGQLLHGVIRHGLLQLPEYEILRPALLDVEDVLDGVSWVEERRKAHGRLRDELFEQLSNQFTVPTLEGGYNACCLLHELRVALWNRVQSGFETVQMPPVAPWAVHVLRDILLDPFREVTLSPEHMTLQVRQLAQAIYQGREFSALPVLADALEEAGVENSFILRHLRGWDLCPVCLGEGGLQMNSTWVPCELCDEGDDSDIGWARRKYGCVRGCGVLALILENSA